MWRATFKALLAKKLRFALTALSVVLGVGFVAGTFVLTDTMNAAFDQLFDQAAGTSDVIVRAESAFTTEQAGPGGGGVGRPRADPGVDPAAREVGHRRRARRTATCRARPRWSTP